MLSRYEQIVRELVTANLTVSRLERQVADIDSTIRDAAAEEQPTIMSKAPPLRQFVVDRVRAVTEQLEGRRRGTPARAPNASLKATDVNDRSEETVC
jgi:hypothetical protein